MKKQRVGYGPVEGEVKLGKGVEKGRDRDRGKKTGRPGVERERGGVVKGKEANV